MTSSTMTLLAFPLLFILFYTSVVTCQIKYISVQDLGGKPDAKTDSTNAFLNAWSSACALAQPVIIYVPPGIFLLRSVTFYGEYWCKNKFAITLRIDGTIRAPAYYNSYWIKFQNVSGLTINGGTLDGQGTGLWACKASGQSCPRGGTSLAIENSNNIRINGLTSLNSQMFHIGIHASYSVQLQGLNVIAPSTSPNTDGIHVQQSSGVTIYNSNFATGDDCISLGPGSRDIWMQYLNCGPGHGISIGSLGMYQQEDGVQNVTVKNVVFTGTQNGVRIKTYPRPSTGFVSGVLYQHITMNNVQNPIYIDQCYNPSGSNCAGQASGVKINGVTYQDIHGTSATKNAVNINCSKVYPCRGIILQDISIIYANQLAGASCMNIVQSTGCL